MVFWAPGRAAHSCTAFSVGKETSVSRANGDLPAGDPRMRCEAGRTDQRLLSHRQVLSFIPPVELFGIGGGWIQHEKFDTHDLSSLDVSDVSHASIGLDGSRDYRVWLVRRATSGSIAGRQH